MGKGHGRSAVVTQGGNRPGWIENGQDGQGWKREIFKKRTSPAGKESGKFVTGKSSPRAKVAKDCVGNMSKKDSLRPP